MPAHKIKDTVSLIVIKHKIVINKILRLSRWIKVLKIADKTGHLPTSYRATAEAVAAPKTKRDRLAELHYIRRGAQNVKDPNFEVS